VVFNENDIISMISYQLTVCSIEVTHKAYNFMIFIS
jgi:hypothetical protein